jgi:hypothetical protein
MIEADSVHSTPPLNSSSIQAINPQPHARAESKDSMSHLHPPGDRPDKTPTATLLSPPQGCPAG